VSAAAAGRASATNPAPPWGKFAVRTAAWTYLVVLLVIPLLVILQDGLRQGLDAFLRAVFRPQAFAALWLTVWTAVVMTAINTVMGTLTAYVLVRYEYPGKGLLNAIIDLPLAIPSMVTGVMLVILYGPQQALGSWLERSLGLRLIFAPPGIILALLFLTYPFVVRTLQPVLMDLDRAPEDAAATLGAGSWTIFRKVTLPALALPLVSGSLLSFSRGIGEFGAIVIVAGNIPFYSQTAAVYVLGEVESENRLGASAISIVMIAAAMGLMLLATWIQRRAARTRHP